MFLFFFLESLIFAMLGFCSLVCFGGCNELPLLIIKEFSTLDNNFAIEMVLKKVYRDSPGVAS